MFTWVVAGKSHNRLALVYLVIAALLFLLALSTWALDASHQQAANHATLQLNITRFGG